MVSFIIVLLGSRTGNGRTPSRTAFIIIFPRTNFQYMKFPGSVFFLFLGLVTTEYGNAQSSPCQYSVLEGFSYCEITNGKETRNNNLPLVVLFHYSSSTPEELLTYFDSLTVPVRLILPRGNHRKRGGYSYYV